MGDSLPLPGIKSKVKTGNSESAVVKWTGKATVEAPVDAELRENAAWSRDPLPFNQIRQGLWLLLDINCYD